MRELFRVKFGAHHFKLAELNPLTISEDYKIQWRKTKTDLSKLARLRWIKKWSVDRIAKNMERSPETIQMYLCQMKKPRGLELALLKPIELELVNKNINLTFKGM